MSSRGTGLERPEDWLSVLTHEGVGRTVPASDDPELAAAEEPSGAAFELTVFANDKVPSLSTSAWTSTARRSLTTAPVSCRAARRGECASTT